MTVASVGFGFNDLPGTQTVPSIVTASYLTDMHQYTLSVLSSEVMSLPQNLGVRNRSFQSSGKVGKPRYKRSSMLACAVLRVSNTQIDLDVDQPAVKIALTSQFDENVGITGVDGSEAIAPVHGDELDDVGFPCVPFKDQGTEDGRSGSVRDPDRALGRARHPVM